MLTRTIAKICETVAERHRVELSEAIAAPYDDVTEFVVESVARMPRLFAVGVRALTVVFSLAGIIYGGHQFAGNGPEQRLKQWRQWQTHRLSPFRDLARLYESLIVLNLYSRPGVGSLARAQAVGEAR